MATPNLANPPQPPYRGKTLRDFLAVVREAVPKTTLNNAARAIRSRGGSAGGGVSPKAQRLVETVRQATETSPASRMLLETRRVEPKVQRYVVQSGESIALGDHLRVRVFASSKPGEFCVDVVDERTLPCCSNPPTIGDFPVLVVEDSLDHAKLIQYALVDEGISRVEIVFSGEDALRRVTEPHATHTGVPALIIIDWELPGLTGAQLLKRLRLLPELRDIPMVVLTAHQSDDIRRQCLAAGATDVLEKGGASGSLRQTARDLARHWRRACERPAQAHVS